MNGQVKWMEEVQFKAQLEGCVGHNPIPRGFVESLPAFTPLLLDVFWRTGAEKKRLTTACTTAQVHFYSGWPRPARL